MRKKHITALVEKTSSSKYVEQRLRRLLQGYVKVYGERICGGSAKKISHGRAAPRLRCSDSAAVPSMPHVQRIPVTYGGAGRRDGSPTEVTWPRDKTKLPASCFEHTHTQKERYTRSYTIARIVREREREKDSQFYYTNRYLQPAMSYWGGICVW